MTDSVRAFALGGLWVLLWGGLAVIVTRIVQ
jgi:hypothetical protein